MELALNPIKKIARENNALVITWQDGEQSAFSHRWLRENAPENRHPITGEKLTEGGEALEITCPRSVTVEYDETLVVAWAGVWEITRYPLAELRDCQPEFESLESLELALSAD